MPSLATPTVYLTMDQAACISQIQARTWFDEYLVMVLSLLLSEPFTPTGF